MSQSQQDFAAAAYTPRAADYVTSPVHARGADLDRIEALLAGRGDFHVLDLGCGGGHVSYRAAPHVARVVAVDVTAAMLAEVAGQAKARGLGNIETVQAPAEALPFEDGAFDAVLCRFTAHHWADFCSGLRAARRVLKPGGFALFIDTVAPGDAAADTFLQSIELLRDSSHIRNYSLAQWAAALEAAGWVLREISRWPLALNFCAWTARSRTPPVFVTAIRALQDGAPEAVRRHFRVAEDGSFTIEAASFLAS